MPFQDPIVAGENLVREGMQSEGFETGIQGWRIERDGDAEFNDVTVRGDFENVGPSSSAFMSDGLITVFTNSVSDNTRTEMIPGVINLTDFDNNTVSLFNIDPVDGFVIQTQNPSQTMKWCAGTSEPRYPFHVLAGETSASAIVTTTAETVILTLTLDSVYTENSLMFKGFVMHHNTTTVDSQFRFRLRRTNIAGAIVDEWFDENAMTGANRSKHQFFAEILDTPPSDATSAVYVLTSQRVNGTGNTRVERRRIIAYHLLGFPP